MNWILAIIGAFVGAALMAGAEWLGGAALGFLVMYLVGAQVQLRQRVDRAEGDLGKLRQRVASAAVAEAAPRVEPRPAAEPAPAAPRAETPAPVAPSDAVAPVAARATPETPAVAGPAPATPSAPRPTAAPPPRTPAPRPPPRPREGPDPIEKALGVVKRWFTEGNVPVKVGVVVLFVGVAAALKYASEQGYFTFPIELRYAAFAALGLVALAFGWRERKRAPAFGLSLQGGAIGILLLTVFAAYRLHPLLPAGLAFALVVLLVAGAATLALLQNNMALAVLGFLGGYLAPVLISTGSGNHVALFSYYAVLNAAVFAVSWQRSWRLLNLIGFAFTFGVGTAWGLKYYRPEMFATVEPFLILFFVFYVVIGLLYVIRQTEHRRPWVDGSLVFGTPLLAFPLQAGLLKDDRLALAFSALAVAAVYLGLLLFLRTRQREKLLTEAYAALAIGFATLAIPLAFSAGTTAGVWALEGVAIAWLGLRQNSNFRWLAGLALQLLAAGAYVIGFDANRPLYDSPEATRLLLNPQWLGAAILALSGFALSLIHERHRDVAKLPALLFVWAVAWWGFGGLEEANRAERTIGAWQFAIFYLATSAAAASLLRDKLAWPRLSWLVGLIGLLGLPMAGLAADEFGAPLQPEALPGWAAYFAAMGLALWQARESAQKSMVVAHLAMLWSIGLLLTLQVDHFADTNGLAQGWRFLATVAPLAVLSFLLWKLPAAAWPREARFPRYAAGWFVPVFALVAFTWVVGLFLEGGALPLQYIPLFNPLELALVGTGALMYAYARERWTGLRPLLRGWPLVGFAFVTVATLRAVHHLHGEPWSESVLDSGFSQTALTVVWTLIGVGAWILGSRRGNRPLWMAGAVLMAIVVLKLLLVDRQYFGDITGIVSAMFVGLLMVGVGYIAPTPPRQPRDETDEPEEPDEPTAPPPRTAPEPEAT